jgi:hypothetical protein
VSGIVKRPWASAVADRAEAPSWSRTVTRYRVPGGLIDEKMNDRGVARCCALGHVLLPGP